jgi:hypothetical protein
MCVVKTTGQEVIYSLGNPVKAFQCFEVYVLAEDPGRGEGVIFCATKELAQYVCSILEEFRESNDEYIDYRNARYWYPSIPIADGYEWASTIQVRDGLAESKVIAESASEALYMISERVEDLGETDAEI